MIAFNPISLSDMDWIQAIAFSDGTRSADFNFTCMYVWDKTFRQSVCRFNDRLLACSRWRGEQTYCFPIGTGPLRQSINALSEHASYSGVPLILTGLEQRHVDLLEEEYPDRFSISEEYGSADYIYSAGSLSSFSGRVLHGKKNHCNRFEAEHKWSFIPFTPDLIHVCSNMLTKWAIRNSSRLEDDIDDEYLAILRAFDNCESLPLEGGVLFADGQVVGFSLGALCSNDCFDVCFEKADIDMNGAYPMVCRETVRMIVQNHPQIKYINREDDKGLESLRISKLSYHPEFLIRKYIARSKAYD